MPSNEQTEKCSYPSLFSPGVYCTAVQLLAEKMCERKAKAEYKELPLQFWKIPRWSQYLVKEIVIANRLVKKYKESAIFSALKDKRCKTVYSLGAKWLIPVIEEYNNKVEVKKTVEDPDIRTCPEATGLRPSAAKKSLASLLD